jgi:hypothetical protein
VQIPAGVAAAAIPAEFFLFVRFFDFRRLHGLREGQRQHVAVVRARLAELLHVRFVSSTTHCVGSTL